MTMAHEVTIFGIKACDTMKKARAWLVAHGVAHDFHDYRVAGVNEAMLRDWVEREGWETLLNRAGTTFRALPEADRAVPGADQAVRLMMMQPAMIKRPVLVHGDRLLVGFKPERYAAFFA